jgi:ABC-type antimicrobial peptide transport system permease subunit
LVFGLIASTGAIKLIRSMLYGTRPYDPVVIAAVILTLLLIALIACIFPALRASRLDPMEALRAQ